MIQQSAFRENGKKIIYNDILFYAAGCILIIYNSKLLSNFLSRRKIMEKVCKAAVVTYNGQVECREMPLPELKDNDKSRDITLPTKVHLVKAMVFPVVMD